MGEGTGLEGSGGYRLLAVLNENRWFWLGADRVKWEDKEVSIQVKRMEKESTSSLGFWDVARGM